MRDDGDLARALQCEVPRRLSTEAVASSRDPCDAFCLEGSDDAVYNGLPGLGAVSSEPGGNVEVLAVHGILGGGLAVEDVRHDRAEAIPRKVIDKDLSECLSGS